MLSDKTNKPQDINDSEDKNLVLKERCTALLFELEQDLQEIKELEINEKLVIEGESANEKNQDEDSQVSFVARHFIELENLKKIFISSSVRIEDVIWFLRSAIFDLMSCESESFSIEPLELYECMLERAELSSRKVFHEHLQALLDKKTDDKSTFPFARFFPVLSAARKRSAELFSERNFFSTKRPKLSRCRSPLLLHEGRCHLVAKIDEYQDQRFVIEPLS